MRDHDEHAFIAVQELLQPMDGVQVKVVGGLVQEQRLRMPEQGLRQQHADLLPALQLSHLALVQRLGDVEPVEQHRGIALSCVAVFFGDHAF